MIRDFGGSFDFVLRNKENTLWKIDTIKNAPIEQNGRWTTVTLNSVKDEDGKSYSIILRDSNAILPGKLEKLTNEYNVKHKKLPETVDHDEIARFMNANNFDTQKLLQKYPQIDKYLEHDVLGLLEVMDNFADDIWEATKTTKNKYKRIKGNWKVDVLNGGLRLTDLMTGASLAKNWFFLKHYDKKRMPVYRLSEVKDKFIRDSYFGGRVELLHKAGTAEAYFWYSFDFTSLFPAMCSVHDLPYGKPYDYNETNWELYGTMSSGWDVHKRSLFEDFFGFVEVQVRTINQELTPLHACKKNQRLTFPILENWTTMKLFSEEIKMGLKHNQYEYIFGNGHATNVPHAVH